MTPSQRAKAAGLKSLLEVSKMLGTKPCGRPIVSPQTLDNWARDKPKLFEVVIYGLAKRVATESD